MLLLPPTHTKRHTCSVPTTSLKLLPCSSNASCWSVLNTCTHDTQRMTKHHSMTQHTTGRHGMVGASTDKLLACAQRDPSAHGHIHTPKTTASTCTPTNPPTPHTHPPTTNQPTHTPTYLALEHLQQSLNDV